MGSNCCSQRDKDPWRQREEQREVDEALNYIQEYMAAINEDEDADANEEIDEENVVIFYDKGKLDKFFTALQQIQTLLHKKSNKYYVPAIITNSPRSSRAEALIVLRNSDNLVTFSVKHMKHSKLASHF